MILNDYIELTKPKINAMVLITTVLGFYLAKDGIYDWFLLLYLIIGAGLVCAGSGVLNQYIEREYDGQMVRTKTRPIPRGSISASQALSFGVVLTIAGLIILCLKVNLLTAFLSLLTSFLYIVVYTPMKRLSWLNTSIGSIPGALPPVGGWAAATGNLEPMAWVLFLIMFVWQHPHFYAIAWMCRKDYAQGGYKMLTEEKDGLKKMFRQIVVCCLLIVFITMIPFFTGRLGLFYFMGAMVIGFVQYIFGQEFAVTRDHLSARNLLMATVFYLPALFLVIVLDQWIF